MVYPVNHWCWLHQEGLSLHTILIAVYSPFSWSPGSLIQVPSVEKGKLSKVRLGSLSLKKEGERQCFLFTKHFLICTRSSGGKLHLLKVLVLHVYFIYVSKDIQVNLIMTFPCLVSQNVITIAEWGNVQLPTLTFTMLSLGSTVIEI